MKRNRQSVILELIRDHQIDTQEELQSLLKQHGFAVTQATVSRDIRALNIVKSIGEDGLYHYRVDGKANREAASDRFSSILKQAAQSAVVAGNLVVVKTYAGMGNAVGAAIDAMKLPECVGTLAGDDTLLLIAKTDAAANEMQKTLAQLLKKETD